MPFVGDPPANDYGDVLLRISHVPYRLYRVYTLVGRTAKLRIAPDLKPFAGSVLVHRNALSANVNAEGIFVKPDVIAFGDEITLELTEYEQETEALQADRAAKPGLSGRYDDPNGGSLSRRIPMG